MQKQTNKQTTTTTTTTTHLVKRTETVVQEALVPLAMAQFMTDVCNLCFIVSMVVFYTKKYRKESCVSHEEIPKERKKTHVLIIQKKAPIKSRQCFAIMEEQLWYKINKKLEKKKRKKNRNEN